MSTPRQIKASEVVKGMRVRWEDKYSDATVTTEGLVSSATTGPAFAHIDLGSARQVGRSIDKDHPVTVLAEPEPEWVEGAWYWVNHRAVMENRVMRRVTRGWSISSSHDLADYSDSEVTVLGRVLIVDWPGDDAARELDAINDGNRSTSLSNYGRTTTHDTILRNVADAIRTQGGAR